MLTGMLLHVRSCTLRLNHMPDNLTVGDRIRVGGGYDREPRWLNGKSCHIGTVSAFIPGQNKTRAAVIVLDEAATCENVTGKYLVLELRYEGAEWGKKETVHVELCEFEPGEKAWQDRRQGQWVESHAVYEKL
jgi:hypothetical protein